LELAGVRAAVGAAVGVVCGASEAGALAAGAGVELEDCCAEHGSVADNRTAQIKMEKVESFTMLLPVFDKKSRRAAKPQAFPEPGGCFLYACTFVSRNAIALPAGVA
jgi:hypothetical protein